MERLLQPLRAHLSPWAAGVPPGHQSLGHIRAIGASLRTFQLLLQGICQLHPGSGQRRTSGGAGAGCDLHSHAEDDDADMEPSPRGAGWSAIDDPSVIWLRDLLLRELWPGVTMVLQATVLPSPSCPSDWVPEQQSYSGGIPSTPSQAIGGGHGATQRVPVAFDSGRPLKAQPLVAPWPGAAPRDDGAHGCLHAEVMEYGVERRVNLLQPPMASGLILTTEWSYLFEAWD